MSRLLEAIWQRMGRSRWLVLWLVNPKYSVGVNGYIMNEQGQLWLQKHRFWPEQAWGLPGGFMKAAESPMMALQREVWEETGLEVEVGGTVDCMVLFRQGLSLCFVATFRGGSLHLDKREILEAQFFDLDSLPQPILDSHSGLIERVRQCLEEDR